jgi:hypothetical protein
MPLIEQSYECRAQYQISEPNVGEQERFVMKATGRDGQHDRRDHTHSRNSIARHWECGRDSRLWHNSGNRSDKRVHERVRPKADANQTHKPHTFARLFQQFLR